MRFDPTRLVAIREQRYMTQQQLATLAGMSLSAISRYEGGSRTPSEADIKRLAKALRVDWLALCSPQTEAVA